MTKTTRSNGYQGDAAWMIHANILALQPILASELVHTTLAELAGVTKGRTFGAVSVKGPVYSLLSVTNGRGLGRR